MTLPVNGEQWPPAQMRAAYEAIQVYDAWLVGDPSQMQKTFAESALTPRGGLLGRLKLPFWGSPNPATASQPPAKLHVPIAGSISRMSANQVFGELFTAEFTDDHDADDQNSTTSTDPAAGADKPDSTYVKASARLKELLDDQAHAAFIAAGELASAHGGSYLKIAWDKDVTEAGPFLVWAGSDTAIPTFRYGRLLSVAFWTKLTDRAGARYVLFEDHTPGFIEYALYESTSKGMVGNRVPLAAHPEASIYAGLVNENSQIPTGSKLLTAIYLPNRKPNPRFRQDPIAQHLGQSDYDGAEAMMDALDGWYTSWDRDFRLGRARIMVPKNLLQLGLPGSGATFNADQEVFTEMGETVGSLNTTGGPGTAGSFIKESQPGIRHKEHLESIEHLYERIYAAAGFSAQSFGESGDVAGVTATEVASREKLTLQSRAAKIMVARPQIILLLAALMDVDEFIFDGPGRDGILPVVEFPDAVGENPEVLARTLQQLNLSESTSIKTRVEMLHPQWDEKQVADEVQAIKDEVAVIPVPTEKDLWGSEDGTPGADTEHNTPIGPDGKPIQSETGAKTPPAAAGEDPKK